jgi:PAS domain S-box-containing protein
MKFMKQREDMSDNEILADKAIVSGIGQIFLWSVTGLALYATEVATFELVCMAIIFVANVGRMACGHFYHEFRSANAWYRCYAVSTLITPIAWSFLGAGFIFRYGLTVEFSVLVFIINAGIVAAATAALSPDRLLARSFIVFSVVPLATALIFSPSHHYFIAAVITIYSIFLFFQIQIQTSNIMKLRDREALVRALVNASIEGIAIHQDSIIIECNRAFETMIGLAPGEAIGRDILSFTLPEDRPDHLRRLNQESAKRAARGLRRDGSEFPIEIYGHWFQFKGAKTRVTCVMDVSERIQAEENLRQSVRQVEALALEREKVALESSNLKSQFLANMSHELRTPLNAIIGIGDLLESTPEGPMRQRYLRTLKHSSESLLNLVNDILDFTKIEGDKIELESLPFNLIEVVEGQADLVAVKARDKRISLTTYIDPNLPRGVKGDYARIGQVFLNLLGNAIKFTEKGTVTAKCLLVGVKDKNVRVRFEVHDTGVGINEEQGRKLFKPFTQADSSTSRKHGGTGLGLSISKRLLERMDGVISFESRMGHGTVFWFEVPLEVEDAAPLKQEYQKAGELVTRVTLIEDNFSSRDVVESYVRSWNYQVVRHTVDSYVDDSVTHAVNEVVIVSLRSMAPELVVKLFRERQANRLRVIAVDAEGLGDALPNAMVEPDLIDKTIANPIRQSDLFNAINDALISGAEKSAADLARTEVPAKSKPVVEDEQFQPARVLVAEDNSTNQMLTLTLLRKVGLQAQAVVNGREAVEAWETGKFDLILMDCQMPEMDGFAATIMIREREMRTGSRIPILALTANVFESDRERCFKSGMDGFIAKPVRKQKLIEELKLHLKLKAANAA